MSGYIADIETDFSLEVEAESHGAYFISFRLGFGPADNKMMSMYVALIPGLSYVQQDGIYDLKLCLRERDLEFAEIAGEPHFTREAADQYIPKDSRPKALDCVLRAVESLVGKVSPPCLTMVTFAPYLPDKALVKYHKIASVINNLHYVTDDCHKAEDGKWYWYFKKDR